MTVWYNDSLSRVLRFLDFVKFSDSILLASNELNKSRYATEGQLHSIIVLTMWFVTSLAPFFAFSSVNKA